MVQYSSAKGGNEGSTEALSRSIWRILNSSHCCCHSDTSRSLQSVRNLPNKISQEIGKKSKCRKNIWGVWGFYTRDKYSIHSLIQKTTWMMCKYDLERCQRNNWRKGETSCKNSFSNIRSEHGCVHDTLTSELKACVTTVKCLNYETWMKAL